MFEPHQTMKRDLLLTNEALLAAPDVFFVGRELGFLGD